MRGKSCRCNKVEQYYFTYFDLYLGIVKNMLYLQCNRLID